MRYTTPFVASPHRASIVAPGLVAAFRTVRPALWAPRAAIVCGWAMPFPLRPYIGQTISALTTRLSTEHAESGHTRIQCVSCACRLHPTPVSVSVAMAMGLATTARAHHNGAVASTVLL